MKRRGTSVLGSLWGIPRHYASPEPTPEDRLLEAEERDEEPLLEAEERDEERRAMVRAMARLSVSDRNLIQAIVINRAPQREVADIEGLSQAAISTRLVTAKRRLAWFLGSGSKFTAPELKIVLEPYMQPIEVAWLTIFWLVGNISEAHYRLGYAPNSHSMGLRMFRSLSRAAKLWPNLRVYSDALRDLKLARLKLVTIEPPKRQNYYKGIPRGPASEITKARLSAARTGLNRDTAWLAIKRRRQGKRGPQPHHGWRAAIYWAERKALGLPARPGTNCHTDEWAALIRAARALGQ